jgi:hypothetical protein
MHSADVEELFEMVAVGDVVELYAERTDEIARLFDALVSNGEPAVSMAGGR